jgi:RimJ/RimL family protein N-acetyltransferase
MPNPDALNVRPLQASDLNALVSYWLDSEPAHMERMGVDLNKLPSRDELTSMLSQQLENAPETKKSYALIWLKNNEAIGHCNVNKIQFGKEAYMHLHLWHNTNRQKGMGSLLVKKSLPYFFNDLQLKVLFCEPYALNSAPNATLKKLGFTFVKEHVTIPGYLNFEQPVKRWKLSRTDFEAMINT